MFGKMFVTAGVLVVSFLVSGLAFGEEVKAKLASLKPKDFPTKPIELVVVYPAGGGMDVTARTLAPHLEKYVGTKCVVVNKTGGGGMVGHLYIAKQAAPDGYTIGVVADSFLTDDIVRSKGEWSYKDTKMLAYISFSPLYWITNVESKYASFSLKELVDFAKKNPDTVSIGVVKDMAFEFLVEKVSMITGAKFKIVPFQGGAPGVTSLLGGHIDVTSAYLTEFRSHATAGKVKAIAQAGEKRDPYMSDVPSFNEGLGIKQILEGASRFCAVPKETPADRVAFLEVAIQAALKDPACIKAYNEIGIEVDSRHMNAVQTTKYVEDMYTDLKEFLTKSGRVK